MAQRRRDQRVSRMPVWMFVLEFAYLVALIVLAAVYVTSHRLRTLIPDPLHIIPIAWFGALGAVTISLDGMMRHNQRWEARYNYWHVARPVSGAVLGTIAFLIFFAVVGVASGQTGTSQEKQPIVYFIVAFLVGYREETFRELIKRATDLLLSPGESPGSASGPVGVTATVKAAGVEVAWQAPPIDATVSSFTVYRDETHLASIDGATTTYTDAAPPAGPHVYAVSAITSDGKETAQTAAPSVTVA